MKNAVDKIDLNKLLNDIESLENIGVDVSFISDIRKLYKLQIVPETHQVIFHISEILVFFFIEKLLVQIVISVRPDFFLPRIKKAVNGFPSKKAAVENSV